MFFPSMLLVVIFMYFLFLDVYTCICVCIMHQNQGFPGGSDTEDSACSAGDLSSIPGSRRSLEKGMATPSSILAWRIPWTEEPSMLYA